MLYNVVVEKIDRTGWRTVHPSFNKKGEWKKKDGSAAALARMLRAAGRNALVMPADAEEDHRVLQQREDGTWREVVKSFKGAEGGRRRFYPMEAYQIRNEKRKQGKKVKVEKIPDDEPRFKIISRRQWGARRPRRKPIKVNWTLTTPSRIHHTAAESDYIMHSLSLQKRAMRKIQAFHMDSRKYSDIGYNYVIFPDGTIFEGRGKEIRGAHTLVSTRRGTVVGHKNNEPGICFAGNYNKQKPTKAQLAAAEWLRKEVGVGRGRKYPHAATFATSCPGKRMRRAMKI